MNSIGTGSNNESVKTPYEEMQVKGKCLFDLKLESFKSNLKESEEYIDQACEVVYDNFIDEILLETVAEHHSATSRGYADFVFSHLDKNKSEEKPSDVEANKKICGIRCPSCGKLSKELFGRHLQKCMKIGRKSSRIASQRLATRPKDSSYAAGSDDDTYWQTSYDKNKYYKKIETEKKKDKPKKPKIKPEHTPTPKSLKDGYTNGLKEGSFSQKVNRDYLGPSVKPVKEVSVSPNKVHKDDSGASKLKDECNDHLMSPTKLVNMSLEDKSLFFSKHCAVRIEGSTKLCARSLKCTHHTNAHRAQIRKLYFIDNNPMCSENTEQFLKLDSVSNHLSTLSNSVSPISNSLKKKEKPKPKVSRKDTHLE